MIRALSSLFQDYRTLRGVIDAVLEGKLGTVTADDVEAPHVARLDLGCYAVLGGDEAHALAAELISAVRAPRELLVPDRQGWRDLLHEIHGERLSDRPMRTFVTVSRPGCYAPARAFGWRRRGPRTRASERLSRRPAR